jgi:aspartokinase/homoserine dehydrogenase 1
VLTGFIGQIQNKKQQPCRNGSNYTASLIANYINAEELQKFTTLTEFIQPRVGADAKRLNLCRIMRQMKWLILRIFYMPKPSFRY